MPSINRLSTRTLRALTVAIVLLPTLTSADPWLAPGDALMRHDLQVLADAGIVRGPITSWPVPWPDIARDVLDAERTQGLSGGEQGSLLRVQRAARRAMRMGDLQRSVRVAGATEPDALRGFASTPREEGEVAGALDWMGERVAIRLQATAVSAPHDDKSLRPDGSYIGVSLWNFMLSAGYMERWWGPGWDGSLILSTSARPVPAITLERNYSDAFDLPVLEWLGPWRAGIVFGQLEGHRTDFDDTRFFAARLTFKPSRHLEIGLSRSAQWCGEGRVCGFDTFSDLFLGRDNRSDSLSADEEPGNQLAGYDARVSSPWKSVPLALYGQMIAEDEAGALPSKFLGLVGAEAWGAFAGGTYRATLEYSDTTCAFSHSEPEFGCAYESAIYTAGYRYRGRSIGHATDSDTRMLALGLIFVTAAGNSWQLKVRDAELNRDATVEQREHTTATLATDLQRLDVSHQRQLLGGRLAASVGFERSEVTATAGEHTEWRVTAEWARYF